MKPGSRASPQFGRTRQRRGIPVQTPATPPLPVSPPNTFGGLPIQPNDELYAKQKRSQDWWDGK
jgi:hypothetical protein